MKPVNEIAAKSVFLLGVNYWPSSSAINMWTEWNAEEIAADIDTMLSLGMNVCRPFLYMPEFMKDTDAVAPLMMERLHYFLTACEEKGLGVFPTFIVGHMSGEDWGVSWSGNHQFITDPAAREVTRRYIGSVVRDTRHYSCITGWLLSNELPNYIGKHQPRDITSWVGEMISVIRAEDPERPVSVGDGVWSPEITGEPAGFVLRELNKFQDFAGLHYYPRGMDAWHHSFTTAFRTKMAEKWGRPVIVEEFGTSTTLCSEENQAHYYRSVFYSALINGALGAMSWCLNDFDDEDRRPYCHHVFEEHFGIVRTDRSLKPAALEFRDFGRIADELTGEGWQRSGNSVRLFIPSDYYYKYPYPFLPEFRDWYDLYLDVFSNMKRAGLAADLVFEPARELERDGAYSHELDLDPQQMPLLFLPRWKTVTKKGRIAVENYIRSGGTVYFSFANDSWVPDWHELAGVAMDCKFGVPDLYPEPVLKLTAKRDWGSWKTGDSFDLALPDNDPELTVCTILSTDAEVLLSDGAGRAFLVRRKLGEGHVLFSALPLEMLNLRGGRKGPGEFIRSLYANIAGEYGPSNEFSVGGDGIEIGVWKKEDLRCILMLNHGWDSASAVLKTRDGGWDILESTVEIKPVGDSFTCDLDRKSVCSIILKKKF